MHKSIHRLSLLASALLLAANVSYACTDIQIKANDGSQIIARTLEFAMPLNSEIVSVPRETSFTTKSPDGKPTMAWKTKFGYLSVNALKQMITVDGMNEQGLAFEFLYLPGNTEYQTVPEGSNAHAIPYFNLGDYVLGNFKTVDEVRNALASLYVYQEALPVANNIVFPVHAAIHDASGKGIVVEFVKGKIQVSNYIGVMTNAPTYQWHVTHLPQFENLSPYNPNPVVVNGVGYGINGQGAGMLGLPGDVSPASRFVKMAYMLHYALPVADAASAVNLAEHIINNVDIPAGIAREKDNGQDVSDITQWSVFKDLTHQILYYHTYDDLTLRAIDMNKVDFKPNAEKLQMQMASKSHVIDMTEAFKKAAVFAGK
jgi:choloylglycine hydrolase